MSILTKSIHENPYWNTVVYDGLTHNDFKIGNLIRFLHSVGIIKKPRTWRDDPNLAYWLGSEDDK